MKNVILVISLLFLSACNSKIKEKVGLSTIGPDEYKVQKGKSLEIPPHYELQSPTFNN